MDKLSVLFIVKAGLVTNLYNHYAICRNMGYLNADGMFSYRVKY